MRKKKVSAEEKIKNVKKIDPKKKIIWGILVIAAFILLTTLFGGGGGSKGKVHCNLAKSKEYNNTITHCEYICRKVNEYKTFYWTPVGIPPYCPGFPNTGYKDVEGDFIFRD